MKTILVLLVFAHTFSCFRSGECFQIIYSKFRVIALLVRGFQRLCVCPSHKASSQTVRSSASSSNFQYPFFSLRSFSSCLCLLSRRTVTSIPPSTFPSTSCFRRTVSTDTNTIVAVLGTCLIEYYECSIRNIR